MIFLLCSYNVSLQHLEVFFPSVESNLGLKRLVYTDVNF